MGVVFIGVFYESGDGEPSDTFVAECHDERRWSSYSRDGHARFPVRAYQTNGGEPPNRPSSGGGGEAGGDDERWGRRLAVFPSSFEFFYPATLLGSRYAKRKLSSVRRRRPSVWAEMLPRPLPPTEQPAPGGAHPCLH